MGIFYEVCIYNTQQVPLKIVPSSSLEPLWPKSKDSEVFGTEILIQGAVDIVRSAASCHEALV